mmetsp:Transcript_39027/g.76722  ORF Transcript_39027/g.76722 Transcript_39027/m.76722 type:complete len:211 (+) Transcript_39027:2052-2684(+)
MRTRLPILARRSEASALICNEAEEGSICPLMWIGPLKPRSAVVENAKPLRAFCASWSNPTLRLAEALISVSVRKGKGDQSPICVALKPIVDCRPSYPPTKFIVRGIWLFSTSVKYKSATIRTKYCCVFVSADRRTCNSFHVKGSGRTWLFDRRSYSRNISTSLAPLTILEGASGMWNPNLRKERAVSLPVLLKDANIGVRVAGGVKLAAQ